MLDFEQLAFIEKWRARALRGVVVALDGTRGPDILVTVRVGELGVRVDLRGRDATGAVRKQRLAIGDRITIAIEYAARDVGPAMSQSVSDALVRPGARIEGVLVSRAELSVVDCGVPLLVSGTTLGDAREGDAVGFVVAEEGRAYLIPTR